MVIKASLRKAIKILGTQSKRKNFWLLALIALLSITTILGLLNINSNVQQLEQAEIEYNAQLFKQLGQSNDLAGIQVEFKNQVQEWKDVLLRGNDPDLFKKYWQQFEQSESKVHQALEDLHRDLLSKENPANDNAPTTQLSAAAMLTQHQIDLNTLQQQSLAKLHLSDKVVVLIEGHELIGKVYREYLARYPVSESTANTFEIDKNVRGIDRWLSEQLSILRQESVTNQESLTAQANALQLEEIHTLRLHIQRGIAAVIIILIANMLLLFDRLRNSAKEFADAAKRSDATIYQLAYSDGLTGLPNRRLFSDKLDHALALSGNTGNYGGLIFLDLDNFKNLNDTKGHAKGDLLLIEVAHRLKNCVRGTDTVARLGGDEFVVILDTLSSDADTALEQANLIAEKISVSLAYPYALNNYTHHGSASLGVVLFNHGEVGSEELLKRADTAMYEAKRAGRNTVRFYDKQTQNALEARSNLEHNMHTALSAGQFALHYQVQVDQHTKPIGVEALLRWQHPELGLLYPTQFISLAEESDLIITLGEWILDTACKQIQRWESNPHTCDLVLSINVSAAQLRRSKHIIQTGRSDNSTTRLRKPDFVEQVQHALTHSGINPARLKLEITESMALHDIEFTIATMLHLKSLGVGIALDDFGVGHSSLTHLKRIPVDQIKIDQSFVASINSDDYDKAIVHAMIDMAASLSISTIAEGVETQEQEDTLRLQGCLSFQGHLYGKPMPAAEFEAWLENAGNTR
ncbi:MAG: EAL domain-containing protein [Gallionella sp.]